MTENIAVDQRSFMKSSVPLASKLATVYCFAKKQVNRNMPWRDSRNHFLDQAKNLADRIDDEKPIFIDSEEAFRFGRYLDSAYCVVKACVLDSAIESKDQSLHLKVGYLQNNMIMGCYPSAADSRVYIKNPDFGLIL